MLVDDLELSINWNIEEIVMTETFESLENSVLTWARDKGIMAKALPANQYKKHVEEVGELGEALILDNRDEIIDAIGDVLVTLIILARLKGLSPTDCLLSAYKEIAGRTGKMVDGVFVKDK